METREFWGRDMNEALQAVRVALGPDALILGTREESEENGASEGGVKVTAMGEKSERDVEAPRRSTSTRGRSTAVREESKIEGLKDICQQLEELKSLLHWLVPDLNKGGVLEELAAQGVPPHLLSRLAQEAEGIEGDDERERMRQALVRLIPTGGTVEIRGEKGASLALIGPPGVGKTTSVVKLTVHLTRRDNRRIGWISLNNRCVANAEQLAVYAGILGIPYELVENKEGLALAVERLSSCELVLIDAAGVSPGDQEGIAELAEFLQDIPGLRRTLVLSAVTNGPDMNRWAKLYNPVGFDSLLFTMVDACGHFGPLLSTALTCGRPLSYIADGQKVTRDLEVANPEKLARLLLP
jgi:flagellar biosynthesis GTPase FlhF